MNAMTDLADKYKSPAEVMEFVRSGFLEVVFEDEARRPSSSTSPRNGGRTTADGQKSGKAETCPMAPNFGAWLLAVPEAERTGPVFRLIDTRTNQPISPHRAGQIVEKIGKAAKVKVGTRMKRDRKTGKAAEVSVFAGCHSFRRGFGSKWARRVAPSVLKRLMRHASIATTEGYYVHMDATDVADALCEKFGSLPTASVPVAVAGLQQFNNTPPVESIGG